VRYDRDYLKIEKCMRTQMLSTSPDTRSHITHRCTLFGNDAISSTPITRSIVLLIYHDQLYSHSIKNNLTYHFTEMLNYYSYSEITYYRMLEFIVGNYSNSRSNYDRIYDDRTSGFCVFRMQKLYYTVSNP
jgi:hypothetical protein